MKKTELLNNIESLKKDIERYNKQIEETENIGRAKHLRKLIGDAYSEIRALKKELKELEAEEAEVSEVSEEKQKVITQIEYYTEYIQDLEEKKAEAIKADNSLKFEFCESRLVQTRTLLKEAKEELEKIEKEEEATGEKEVQLDDYAKGMVKMINELKEYAESINPRLTYWVEIREKREMNSPVCDLGIVTGSWDLTPKEAIDITKILSKAAELIENCEFNGATIIGCTVRKETTK